MYRVLVLDKRQLRTYKRKVREAEQRVSKKIIDRMIELRGDTTLSDTVLGEPTNQETQLFKGIMKQLSN